MGEIPEGWEIKKLKYNLTLQTGKITIINQSVIALENIASWSGQYIPTESKYQGDDVEFKKNDILFGKLRPYLAKVYQCQNNGVAFGDVLVYRPTKQTESKFAFYTMLSEAFIDIVDGATYGSKMPRASVDFVNNMPIAIASLPEQQTIANYLDKATAKIDALIAKQTRLIALLKEKRLAVISTAVTRGLDSTVAMKDSGVEWLGEIPEHWDISTLKFQLTNIDFRRIPISASERGDIQGVYPYYGASGIIDFVEDYIFDEMTILIGEDGANLLSKSTPLAFIADGKYWVNNHAHILKPKDSLFNYWTYVLNNLDLTPFISGSAQPKLTAEALGNLVTVFPESITDRILIANYLDDKTKKIDNLISKSTQAIDLLKEKRTALISSAVTGKIDVREHNE